MTLLCMFWYAGTGGWKYWAMIDIINKTPRFMALCEIAAPCLARVFSSEGINFQVSLQLCDSTPNFPHLESL